MALPRIIGGVCEFCGTKAVTCQHAAEFRAAGLLNDAVSKSFMEKMLQEVSGLPRVIDKICEHCGVYFLDAKCIHLAARRKAIFGNADAKDDTVLVAKDTAVLEAEQKAREDAARALETSGRPVTTADLPPELGGEGKTPAQSGAVESSGDAEMDKLMDAGDPPPIETGDAE